jgi:hypothetical protein
MTRRSMNAGMMVALAATVIATATPRRAEAAARRTIVVTHSILGSVVKELAGDRFEVAVAIPNGMDPHEWEPSARDVERLTHADLVVANGLDLEGGMQRALDQARRSGVKFFTAADHVTVRRVGRDEGIPSGDPDQATGAPDPHLCSPTSRWTGFPEGSASGCSSPRRSPAGPTSSCSTSRPRTWTGARETYRGVMRDLASAGCSAVVATHDLEDAACSDLALLLAQRVVAFGKPREVLTAEALLSTFGIVARHGEGGVLIVEHDHGHSCEADRGMP